MVTSFEVARGDIDLIDELPWSCIFIDEVHRVKNPKSKLTEAFSRFTCGCRFGLSGTGASLSLPWQHVSDTYMRHPVIQNGYEELWTVLNWTNPGAVGTRRQWEVYVEKPLRVGQSKSASDEEHVKAVVSIRPLSRIRLLISVVTIACRQDLDGEAFAAGVPSEVGLQKHFCLSTVYPCVTEQSRSSRVSSHARPTKWYSAL